MEAQPSQIEGRRESRPRRLDADIAKKVGRAIDAAAALLGGREAMAEKLSQATGEKIGPTAFGNWKARGVPFEHCMPIEDLTAGKITRADLRPHDYLTHWPDLRPAQAA